ncbi:MAG: hypothetical protein ACRDQ1_09870 [Sciscionella sp.]
MTKAATQTGQPSDAERDTALTTPHANIPDRHEVSRHPVDAVVADPMSMAPLCDEAQFAMILDEMVADAVPRLFAVVQEYGQRVDGRIAAWGMAFDDRAEVVAVERGLRMSLRAPEDALRAFSWGSHIRARVVWTNADAATSQWDAIS